MSDLLDWLQQNGLTEFQTLFETEQLDLDILQEITEADLIGLGLKLGPRKRILRAIAKSHSSPPDRPAPRALERRQLSVLFCDLVGSTELSSQLELEDFRHLIRAYQDNAVGSIKRWNGVVSRYMGDGLMAYFGYPQASDRDAERAVRAGLDVVASMSSDIATAKLQVRVGIATGLVVVGDLLGDDSVEELAALGAAPNLAARIQSMAKPNSVVIGQTTRDLTRGAIETVSLGASQIKGFTTLQSLYQVTGLSLQTDSRLRQVGQLLGRNKEIDQLTSLWQRVISQRHPQTVLIIGEPGIGKSRVARAFEQSVSEQSASSATTLLLHGSPFHTVTGLFPFIEELRERAEIEIDDCAETIERKLITALSIANPESPIQSHQTAIFNMLAMEVPKHLPPLASNPGQRKEAALAALEYSFQAIAQQRPLLLLIEDAHWFDPTSLELLQRLIQDLRDRPVMFIITARPEFRVDALTAPVDRAFVHMSIGGLPREAIEALILQNTNNKPLPGKLFEDIISKTDGVPLFVEELTRSVVESGIVVLVDRYEYADEKSTSAIPSSLQDSLMSRIDRLGAAKTTIQFASAFGRSFRSDLLQIVCGLGESEYNERINRILHAGLIFQETNSEPRIFTFKHALIQDIAYESMLREHRTDLHHDIANLLIEQNNTAAEIIAFHLEAGGRAREALDYWHSAGETAVANSHNQEAISHLERGIAIANRIEQDGTLELPLQVLRAACLRGTAGLGDKRTGEALERAHTLCIAHDNRTLIIPALNGLYAYYMEHSQHEKARSCASEILREAQAQHNDNFRMVGLRALGALDFHAAKYDEAIAGLNTALAIYDIDVHGSEAATYGIDHKLTASCFLSFSLLMKGYTSDAIDIQNEALRHSAELNHKLSICQALAFATLQAILFGDYSLADGHATRLANTGSDFAMLHGAAHCMVGIIQFETDQNPAAALEQMEKGSDKWWATNADNYRSWVESVMARTCAKANDPARAWEFIESAKARIPGSGETWAEPEILRVEAWLHQHHSNTPDALAKAAHVYDTAHRLAIEQGSPLWQARVALWFAQLHIQQNNKAAAIELLKPIHDLFPSDQRKPSDAIQATDLLRTLSS